MKKPKLIYPIIIHATNTISDLPVILDDIMAIYSDDRYSPSRKGTNVNNMNNDVFFDNILVMSDLLSI